jgi:NlpC/P60 family/Transglycosylase-like domain
VRRLIVIAAVLLAVMTSALSASATTRQLGPRLASYDQAAAPARPVVVQAAALAAMKQIVAKALLARDLAQHNAHAAHVRELARRTAHAQHLHLLHVREVALWEARAQARSAAQLAAAEHPAVSAPAPAAARETGGTASGASYSGSGGFQSCVISRESGGNPNVMNGSGHYGLYQFSEGTWEAYGGSASTFGHASVAEQNQVFDNAMAQGGASNWSPYDGCEDAVIKGAAPTTATLTALIRPLTTAASAAAHAAHLAHLAHLAREKGAVVLTAVSGTAAGALRWAVALGSGHPYVYGAAGPSAYDCSGLVMAAYAKEGISLPHSTYAMLSSGLLVATSHPEPGDLAFFGSGHVELYVRAGETFGAHDSADGIGYMPYGGSWSPSGFYSVR